MDYEKGESSELISTSNTSANGTVEIEYQPESGALDISNDAYSSDWQSTKSELKEGFEFIFSNQLFCDVHFIVGSGSATEKISAHKLVLVTRSAVFCTMFSKKWSTEQDEIEVPDVTPAAFTEVLKFFYSDKVSLTSETVMEIMYSAKKYAVRALENKCSEFLKGELCPENSFTMLIQARLFDNKELVEACLKVIDDYAVVAVAAEDFCDIDIDTLCLVLKRDSLRISEIMLFEAVVRWSAAECRRKNIPEVKENRRLVAERALPLVRFPLMFEEEFASRVVESRLLSDEELVKMLSYFLKWPRRAPPIGFCARPRRGLDLVVNRFAARFCFEELKCDGSTSQSTGFSADRDVQLIGFGLYGRPFRFTFSDALIMELQDRYLIDMVLKEEETNRILYWNCGFYDGQDRIFRIWFRNPIKLSANTQYQVTFLMKGKPSGCGAEGLSEVTLDLPNDQKVKISFHNVCEPSSSVLGSKTSVSEGQIPELIFHM